MMTTKRKTQILFFTEKHVSWPSVVVTFWCWILFLYLFETEQMTWNTYFRNPFCTRTPDPLFQSSTLSNECNGRAKNVIFWAKKVILLFVWNFFCQIISTGTAASIGTVECINEYTSKDIPNNWFSHISFNSFFFQPWLMLLQQQQLYI